jgi:hypothetical protein
MARAEVTTNTDTIRQWAESRGGHPATVKGTGSGNDPGVLRIDFDPRDEKLEEISWEEFAEKFEDADLAFLYQETTANGEESRFHKFVSRDAVDESDQDQEADADEDLDDEDEDEDDEEEEIEVELENDKDQ